MPLFTQDKKMGVQSFVLKVVNNNCPELRALIEGPRLDRRVNLTVVVLVVPLDGERPLVDRAFSAVTREFSGTGVGLVLDEPKALDEVILGFRWEGEMTFVRAASIHLHPMGGGFFQVGFRLEEMIHVADYPEFRSLGF